MKIAFQKMGFDKCVVVLTRNAEYVKKEEQTKAAKIFYKKYPKFIKALERRHLEYNETVKEIVKMEQEGKVFVIRPGFDLDIGRIEKDPNEIQRVYDVGRKDAVKLADSMLEWLKN